jgi:hypothetical protein
LNAIGSFVLDLSQVRSPQFRLGSINPPTLRPIPPPLASDWIFPPEIPEATSTSARDRSSASLFPGAAASTVTWLTRGEREERQHGHIGKRRIESGMREKLTK